MRPLDWPALMRVGISHLRLQPEQFWGLTPVELLLLVGHIGPAPATTRDALERLSRAFPDDRKST